MCDYCRQTHRLVPLFLILMCFAIPAEVQAQSEPPDSFVGFFAGPVLGAQWEIGRTFDLTIGVQASGKYYSVGGACGMWDGNPYGGATIGVQYSFWRRSVGFWAIARGGYGTIFLNDFGLGIGPHLEWGREQRVWGVQTTQALGPMRLRQVWSAEPVLLQADFSLKVPVIIPEIVHARRTTETDRISVTTDDHGP